MNKYDIILLIIVLIIFLISSSISYYILKLFTTNLLFVLMLSGVFGIIITVAIAIVVLYFIYKDAHF